MYTRYSYVDRDSMSRVFPTSGRLCRTLWFCCSSVRGIYTRQSQLSWSWCRELIRFPFEIPSLLFTQICVRLCSRSIVAPLRTSRDERTHRAVTSQNLWSWYDHHFVGITWHNVWMKLRHCHPMSSALFFLRDFRFRFYATCAIVCSLSTKGLP